MLGPLKGFQIPDYYAAKPGATNQLRSILQGAVARPQSDGRFLIEGFRLTMFEQTGRTNALIEAKDCVYESKTKSVYSTNSLKARSGNGNLAIGGVGFFWSQTNNSVTISNQVRTRIEQDQPIDIEAVRLEFNDTQQRLFYESNVVVTGTNIELHGGQMEVWLTSVGLAGTTDPKGKERPTNQIKRIILRDNVSVLGDKGSLNATGQKLEYSNDQGKDIVELTGNPAWHQGQREGRAEIVNLVRQPGKPNRFSMSGNTFSRLPRSEFSREGAIFNLPESVDTNSTVSISNSWVEIWADQSDITTNDAHFVGTVHLMGTGDETESEARCGFLSLESSPTNRMAKTLIMETNVLIRQGEFEIASERLQHDSITSLAQFDRNARWKSNTRSGSGDKIWFQSKERRMDVLGHAKVSLDLAGANLPFSFTIPGQTNKPARPLQGVLEVTADQYQIQPGLIVFKKNVLARRMETNQCRGRLVCEQLTIRLSNPGNNLEELLAENGVLFEEGDLDSPAVAAFKMDSFKFTPNAPAGTATNAIPNYQKLACQRLSLHGAKGQITSLLAEGGVKFQKGIVEARGRQLVLDPATSQFRLEGDPEIIGPRFHMTGPVIFYDIRSERAYTPGEYKWTYTPAARNQATNTPPTLSTAPSKPAIKKTKETQRGAATITAEKTNTVATPSVVTESELGSVPLPAEKKDIPAPETKPAATKKTTKPAAAGKMR